VLLLDASAWVAAIDVEDRFHESARALVLSPRHAHCALDLTLYEVSNVVGVVKEQPELAARICRVIIQRSEDRLVRVSPTLSEHAVRIAAEHALTAYDAAYVVAAAAHDAVLVSTDLRDLVKPGLARTPDDPALPEAH
jgi:predicted nucleic acid-binding protein